MKKYLYLILLAFLASACSSEDELSPVPKEYKDNVVNPDYVSIDWNKTRLIKADPTQGEFTFSANDITEQLHPGNVLTIDADTASYLVVVTQTKTNADGGISVKTKQGDLCDIFANASFTFTTDPTVSGKNVCQPVAVRYRDENQQLRKRDVSTGTDLTGHLIKYTKDFAKENKWTTFCETSNAKIYMEKALIEFDLFTNLNLSFGGRSAKEMSDNAFTQYRSKALSVEATLNGAFNTDFKLNADVKGKYVFDPNPKDDNENNKYELIKPNVLYKSVEFLTPTTPPVPVWIDLSMDLFRSDSLTADGELSFTTGVSTKSSFSTGVKWTQKDGDTKPVFKLNQNTDITYPTLQGKGSITGRAYLFPRFYILPYGVAGPSFDVKPYIGVQAKGGFKATASPTPSADDYLSWSLRNFVGLDGQPAISLKFMNYEVEHFNLLKPFRFGEWDIYKSPTDIQFLRMTSNGIVPGVKNTVTFAVYDTGFNTAVPTPLFQFVKFESNGLLSKTYGLTNLQNPLKANGEVSVDWTPVSQNDYLKAILYDPDGNVIKEAMIGKSNELLLSQISASNSYMGHISYQYNNEGKVTNISMPDGKVTLGYNPFSMISSDYDTGDGTETIRYSGFKFDGNGRLVSLKCKSSNGDSWTQTFTYDSNGHPTGNVQTYSDGFVDKMTMEWKDGNLIKATDTGYDGKNIEETESYTLTYDDNVLNKKHQISYGQIMSSWGMVHYQTAKILGDVCSQKLPSTIHNYYKYYGSEDGDGEDAQISDYRFAYTFNADGYISKETMTSGTMGSGDFTYTYGLTAGQKSIKRGLSTLPARKLGRKTRRHKAFPFFSHF